MFGGSKKDNKRSDKSPAQVPILAPQQIQKLEILKRASIHHQKQGRKSIRPSQGPGSNNAKQQQQHKYTRKQLKDDTNDSQDTIAQTNKKMEFRQQEQTVTEKCCSLFQKEQKYENPFKMARKTIKKN